MALYRIESNVSSYAKKWGLDTDTKVIQANSEAEAKRLAYSLTGIPGAALQVSVVPPAYYQNRAGGVSMLSDANVNLPSAAPADGSFTSMVASVDPNYDPSGGAYSTFKPPAMSVGNLGGINQGQYDPQGGGGFDSNRLNGGASPVGYNPTPGVYNEFDEAAEIERFRRQSMSNPLVGDLDNQLFFGDSQANAVPDFMTGAELDAAEAAQFALDQRKRDDQLREEQKQASLVSGPVRSWDAKLADITVNADGTVNLPTDMWRNSSTAPSVRGGSAGKTASQNIGREQLEDAIRKIAELGGRKDLNANVERLLRDARAYYSSTPRGDSTWDKNIDSGLIDGKLLFDDAFKATWGSFADEVLGAREADVTGQIPNAWANNPDGFKALSKAQQTTVIENNLKSMSEFESYTAGQANQLGSGAEALYDTGKGVGLDEELPDFTTKGFDFSGADDGLGGTNGGAGKPGDPTGLAGTGNEDLFMAGAMQGFPVPPVPPVPPVLPPQAFGDGGQPVYTSQELINDPQGYLTAAGQRLAFRNVFGDAATGVGPLSSYLQRQTYPLTNAYRGSSWANMGREQAGGVAPQVSFEDFLRTVQQKPTGLSGAFGQTLQDVNYLRGLEGSQVPVGLEGVFNPEQASGTRDARNLLQAAQRGKYSGLVSNAFRRPSEDDLFSDYVLAKQDATTAGTVPQNFFNFAASRYGV